MSPLCSVGKPEDPPAAKRIHPMAQKHPVPGLAGFANPEVPWGSILPKVSSPCSKMERCPIGPIYPALAPGYAFPPARQCDFPAIRPWRKRKMLELDRRFPQCDVRTTTYLRVGGLPAWPVCTLFPVCASVRLLKYTADHTDWYKMLVWPRFFLPLPPSSKTVLLQQPWSGKRVS